MASPSTRRDLKACDPQPPIAFARESVTAVLSLSEVLAKRDSSTEAAAALGAMGGNATKAANLSRDPDYCKTIAAMRKTQPVEHRPALLQG